MHLLRHAPVAGVFSILTAASLGSSHVTALKTMPMQVVVTNSTSSPVPVSPQGTTQVAGTVAVSSLPSVQLQSGTSVAVNNQIGSPIPVLDVRAAGRTPVHEEGGAALQDGTLENGGISLYTVPNGKRLVIQSMYMVGSLPAGELIIGSGISGSNGFESYPISFLDHGTDSTTHYYGGFSESTLYFSAGDSIQGFIVRNDGTGTASYDVGFDGYLEDAS